MRVLVIRHHDIDTAGFIGDGSLVELNPVATAVWD